MNIEAEEKATCPYCGSIRLTPTKDGLNVQKYHCNSCNTSTSDTVHTIWHHTHLSVEQRNLLIEAHSKKLSCRKAAEYAGVGLNTAHSAYLRIDGLYKNGDNSA